MTPEEKRALKRRLKDQIKEADDLKRVLVDMPEWGNGEDGKPLQLEVVGLTFPEQVALEKECAGMANADAGLVALMHMTHMPGEPETFWNFKDDFTWLKGKGFDALNKLTQACIQVRSARLEKIQSAEKNSETGTSESSS